ncbi:hypothetical protein Scep_003136 [Stephania cephalantha]|uniref:50S ribosomal protein 5, chloroplastic n=1 Tax=Stephania cephalantha TaxID=152367 RepID=A0AAP0PU54_9MAGN
MALLHFNSPVFSSFSSFPTRPSTPTSPIPSSGLHGKCLDLRPRSINANQSFVPFVKKQRVGVVIARASSDGDGIDSVGDDQPGEAKEEPVSVESLPLESKLQERLDQKLKMKLAKKIRLRRKRLVRKRMLRKKGRWPPSKMKKNKNV